jgi:tripartite-type tricarboxylate transporter receptor subunit TctC
MRRTRCWIRTLAIGLVGVAGLSAAPALAESWPQRQVRIIVPTGAGGGTDTPARLFAERLAERWKQPVIVENRPGGEGIIAVVAFAGMRDDHALLFSPAAPISVFPLTQEKLPYDPARDVVPISLATENAITISASASLKVSSLRELVTLARSQAGKLNYNTGGGGALTIVFAGFLKTLGLDMVQVNYRDLSLLVQDLGEGRIHVMISTLALALPSVQAGKVRYLAVANKTRAPLAPEVPTAT